MKIWIFVALLSNPIPQINLPPIQMFESPYAFTTKETCEWAIKGLPTLKCIPIILLDNKMVNDGDPT